MSRWRSYAAPALAAVCALLFVAQARWMPAPLTLVVEVKTTHAARLQLLYNAGRGFNDQDSASVIVEHRDGFRKVRFPIAARRLSQLRLVQWNGAGPLELRHLTLQRFRGNRVPISSSVVQPATYVANIGPIDGGIRINGNPLTEILAVDVSLPVAIEAGARALWLESATLVLLALSAIALLWLPFPETAWPGPSRRTVVVSLTLAYLLASLFELNGSSTGFWRQYADRESPDALLLAGASREIRSDEWMVQTPWIFSQLHREPKLSLTNPNVGDGPAPLLTNLPARHWSMFFRPQMWGFFCLGEERAFAFSWNFKWFALLLGAFLFLDLVTAGKTLVALSGALFFFASAYVQWWFSTPTCMPEMVAMLFFMLWFTAMIFRLNSKPRMIFASVGLLCALLQFVFCCYPRFQIPLAYTGAVLLACGCARGGSFTRFRVVCLGSVGALAVLLLWPWYREVADLIRLIGTLAYPGRIVSTGGGVTWTQLFAPFLEFGMTDRHYPAGQMNVCEAAGFLFVTPLLAAVALRDAMRRRFDPLVLGALVFSALLFVFMWSGIPLWLARVTGWSQVYGARALLAFGLISTVGLFRALAAPADERASSPVHATFAFAAVALLLFLGFTRLNLSLGSFVGATGVIAAALFFALVSVTVWSRRTSAACVLLALPLLCAHGLTNPIGRGLPGLTQSPLAHRLTEMHQQNPAAKWLVLGRSGRTQALSQFIRATGADSLGGTRVTPDEQMLRVLDPEGRARSVYERYAVISVLPGTGAEATFELTFVNSYTIHLPLRRDLLDRLGVGYILQVDLPEADSHVDGFRVLGEWEQCRVLAREPAAAR